MKNQTVKTSDKEPIETDMREQAIVEYIIANGSISNNEARELLNIADTTVKRLLAK